MPTVNGYIEHWYAEGPDGNELQGSNWLTSTAYLGLVLSAFSLTRTGFFVVFGWWSDKRDMREPFLFSFVLCIIGDMLYALAWATNNLNFILIGRLVAGVGGANTTLTQAYFARAFPPSKRTKVMALGQGAGLLGVFMGPALNILFVNDIKIGNFTINEYTAPGFVMGFVNTLSLLGFWLYFKDPPPDRDAVVKDASFYRGVRQVILHKAAWFCLLGNFIIGFEITALETAITPITKDWGWSTMQNSLLFCGIAIVAVIAIVSCVMLDKQSWTSNRGIIALGFGTMGLSFLIAFLFCGPEDIPLWALFTFAFLFIFGLMLMNAPITSLYTVLVGEKGKGVYMGYAQIMLGSARMCGPLAPSATLKPKGAHWYLFSALFAVFILGPIGLAAAWTKMHMKSAAEKTDEDVTIFQRVVSVDIRNK
jgi:MFS family permease